MTYRPDDTFERFYARMAQECGPVKPNGPDRFLCYCPAHEDNRAKPPSLSFWRDPMNGHLYVRCFAGCTWRAVFSAAGLDDVVAKIDEYLGTGVVGTRRPQEPAHRPPPARLAPQPPKQRRRYASFQDAVRGIERWKCGQASAWWIWGDGHGETIAATVRIEAPDGSGKVGVFPVTKISDDCWEVRAPEAPRPLYRLEDLKLYPDHAVIVVEGERAAEAGIDLLQASTAAAAGQPCVVTTSWGGASGAGKTSWHPLRGREVIIVPDNDDAGAKYAQSVFACLAGIARSVHIVNIGDLVPELRDVKGADFADVKGGA